VRNKIYIDGKCIPKVVDITFKFRVPAALGAATTDKEPGASASSA